MTGQIPFLDRLDEQLRSLDPSRPSGRSGRTAFVAIVAAIVIALVFAGVVLTGDDGGRSEVATPDASSTTVSSTPPAAWVTSSSVLADVVPDGTWTFVPANEAGLPDAPISEATRLGDRLYATTSNDPINPRVVVVSEDSGAHWREVASLPPATQASIVALGGELLILESPAGDGSWSVRHSLDGIVWGEPEPIDVQLGGAVFSEDGALFGASVDGDLVRSNDGRSWSIELPGVRFLGRVGDELWAANDAGMFAVRQGEFETIHMPGEVPVPTRAARTPSGLTAFSNIGSVYIEADGVVEQVDSLGPFVWPLSTRHHLHLVDVGAGIVRSTADGMAWTDAEIPVDVPLYSDHERLVLVGGDEEGVDGLWVFTEAGVEPPRTGLASPVSQPTTTVEAPSPAPSLCTAPTPQANELHVDYVVLGPVSPILPGDILVADGEAAHVIRDGVDIGLAAEGGVVAAFHDLAGGLVVADDNGGITHVSTVGRLPSLLAQSGPPDGSGEWSIYDVAEIDGVSTAILRHILGIEEARHGEFVFVPLDGGERWSLPNRDYYEGGTWTAQWDGEGLVVAEGGEGLAAIGRIGRDGEDLAAPWNESTGESAFYRSLDVAVGPERVAVYAAPGEGDEVSLTLFDTTEPGLTVGGFVTRMSDRDRVLRLDLSRDVVIASVANLGGTCTLVIDPINGTVSELPFGGYATVG